MTDDSEANLSDILERWYRWQKNYRYSAGYPARSAGVGNFKASRQYDSENGALDAALEGDTMQDVDFEISQIAEPGRTGLHVNARALVLHLSVFRSPRLPEDRMACLQVIANARDELARRLLLRGILR